MERATRTTACIAAAPHPRTGRRRPGARAWPDGVTLMEVLMALAFMAVVTVGVAGLGTAILNGNTRSRALTTAMHLAQDRLETIRNTDYDVIVPDSFPDDTPLRGISRTTAIQSDTPVRGVKRVVVTVSWRGGSAQEETLVSR